MARCRATCGPHGRKPSDTGRWLASASRRARRRIAGVARSFASFSWACWLSTAPTGWTTWTRAGGACAWARTGSDWTRCNGATWAAHSVRRKAGGGRRENVRPLFLLPTSAFRLRRRQTRTPPGHNKPVLSSLERRAHGVPRGRRFVGMARAQHRGLVEGPADHLEPHGQAFRRQPTGQRERREADQVGGVSVVQERALHSAARRALLGEGTRGAGRAGRYSGRGKNVALVHDL